MCQILLLIVRRLFRTREQVVPELVTEPVTELEFDPVTELEPEEPF
jgi:hypothetical protein